MTERLLKKIDKEILGEIKGTKYRSRRIIQIFKNDSIDEIPELHKIIDSFGDYTIESKNTCAETGSFSFEPKELYSIYYLYGVVYYKSYNIGSHGKRNAKIKKSEGKVWIAGKYEIVELNISAEMFLAHLNLPERSDFFEKIPSEYWYPNALNIFQLGIDIDTKLHSLIRTEITTADYLRTGHLVYMIEHDYQLYKETLHDPTYDPREYFNFIIERGSLKIFKITVKHRSFRELFESPSLVDDNLIKLYTNNKVEFIDYLLEKKIITPENIFRILPNVIRDSTDKNQELIMNHIITYITDEKEYENTYQIALNAKKRRLCIEISKGVLFRNLYDSSSDSD